MLSKYAATAVLLTAVTTASPLLSYYTITGATGGVYPRLEIRDLEKTGMLQRLLWFSS
jgi:hypothetical protein